MQVQLPTVSEWSTTLSNGRGKSLKIQVFIDAFRPCSCRVADRDFRQQLGAGITGHRLQCRQFIETQFLVQAFKLLRYPVRLA
jgi:hypothetical protein